VEIGIMTNIVARGVDKLRRLAYLAGFTLIGSHASLGLPAIFGMNFDFDQIDLGKVSECGPQNRGATSRGHAFLVRYSAPGIRETVRAELAQMRRAEFQSIRIIIFFGKESEGAGRNPTTNMFSVEDYPTAAPNLSAFISDVRQAGFSRLVISFGPQGTLAPACRRSEWGDCFDGQSVEAATDFIINVRKALNLQGLNVLIEFENEGVYSHFVPQRAQTNMTYYLNNLMKTYFRYFPNDETTISVQQRQADERLSFVWQLYEQLGHRPALWDVHIYDVRPAAIAEVATALRGLPPIPMVVGEFPYGNPSGLQALTSILAPARQVIFWPVHGISDACGIDAAPPYDLTWTGAR
jgi:hypothetical protein